MIAAVPAIAAALLAEPMDAAPVFGAGQYDPLFIIGASGDAMNRCDGDVCA